MSSAAITISVVVPAYNAAATIVGAVASCLEQSLPPFEVIVVNDGSTDGTEEIVLREFGERLKYIALERNSGPAAARNAGLAAASGSHVAFQDADDLWHPDKLRVLAGVVEKMPQITFLFHPYTLKSLDYDAMAMDATPTPFAWRRLLWSNPIGTPCVLLRNHAALRFDERMHHMEDLDLWLREGYGNGIWQVDIPLTQVQRPILSAGGQSGNRWKMRMGELRAFSHLGKLNPLLLGLWPVLAVFGLGKHFVKAFRPPRSDY